MLLPKRHGLVCKHVKNDLVLFSKTYNLAVNNCGSQASYSEVTLNSSSLRRGTGGRSSFSGVVATVFGASGFFGKYIVNQLGKIGSQVIIPYRGTSYAVRELRVLGDLGQMLFLPLDVRNDENIRKAIKYSNVVINLIGKDTETKNFSHEYVHVDLASRIARLSKEMGVETLIHVSALNASPTVPEYIKKGGSSFLRTKGQGELDVRREFPEVIVFRPSDMYGHQDRFLNYYYRNERRMKILSKVLVPVWRHGQETTKQPVFAGDVARGMIKAVTDPVFRGKTIEAVGPHRYRLDHLIWWIYMTVRIDKDTLDFVEMNWLMRLKVMVHEMLKRKYPVISIDRLERECFSDELQGLPDLSDLGVNLTSLEDRMHYEMRYLRKMNSYWEGLNEYPPIQPPPRVLF